MTSKLTFNAIAATLAALGASGVVACSSNPPAQSPVDAKEVPGAKSDGATGSCGADANCGAQEKASSGAKASCGGADGSCGAGKTDEEESSVTDVHQDPAPGQPPTEKAAATMEPKGAQASCSASSPGATKKSAAKKNAGAKGGCGAGTCG